MEDNNIMISTALESGDFHNALHLLENMTSDQLLELTLPDKCTPLHYACQHGRVDIAQQLITHCKYSIESKDVKGCTPLHTAAQYGQVRTLKYLLNNIFVEDINLSSNHKSNLQCLLDSHRDQSGNTPLHTACAHGQLDIVQLLTREIGCDPNGTNSEGLSCLHLATQHGHLPLVRYLIEEVGSDVTFEDGHGRSPTYLAAGGGHLDILKYLIREKGADPQYTTSKEWNTAEFSIASCRSLVHTASREGHLHVVRYLVEQHGCDLSHKDDKGVTPLYLAHQLGHMDIVAYLDAIKYLVGINHCELLGLDQGNNLPLHLDTHRGHLDTIKFFIEDLKYNPNCCSILKETSLRNASQNGHLDVAKYLIDIHHCDPLCPDKDNNIPLHFAALNGHLDIVKFFIEDLKCDPNCKGNFKTTSLHRASQNCHINVVKYLVDIHHCDPLCPDEYSNTPLHLAALNGHLDIVKFFIKDLKCDLNCKGNFKRTSLHYASEKGHIDIVKCLVNMHCDLPCLDEYSNIPLHFAALKGHLDIVKFFIEDLTCDPNCKNNFKRTSLHYASQEGHIDIVKYLVNIHHCDPLCPDEDSNTPLHLAALKGHLDIVKFFIEDLKCDPNCKGNFKRIPLHDASQNGHIEVVKYLVDIHHCDPLCPDEDSNTPLHLAAHLDIVKFFIEDLKCDPNCKGNFKRIPLHDASQNGHIEVVKYLVDIHHCDPWCPDEDSNIPLQLAAFKGHLNIVKFFIEDLKCDPNCKDKFKRTPLHDASQNGHIEVVKYLADIHHCDPLCQDVYNKTPLQLAITYNRFDIIRYFSISLAHEHLVDDNYNDSLLHYAALKGSLGTVQFLIEEIRCDPNCKNQHKRTPLHHACKQLHFDVVKFLIKRQHCDPLSPDEEGTSPLHLAILKAGCDESLIQFSAVGSIKAVKFLIEDKKCDLNYKDHSGKTPLHHASEGGHLDVVDYFVNYDPSKHLPYLTGQLEVTRKFIITHDHFNNAPLHYAAQNGHLEVVKFLTEDIKCDPNCIGQFGRIPLHYSSEGGHLDCVKYLVETYNCDPLWLDENKNSPLHKAVLYERFKIISYFANRFDCKLFAKDDTNNSLLHFASFNGYLEIVKLFIDRIKCDPNSIGEFGRTPLHRASEGGHLDIVKYLVDIHHSNPLCLEEDGQTPLHRAAANGHLEVVRFFTVILSCDPSPMSKSNLAPVHMAARNGHLGIVKFFIEGMSCDPNIKDNITRTPLHYASEGGHLEVVKYFINLHHSDEDKKSLLHYAAKYGHLKVVKLLIEECAVDPNIRGHSGWTPLICAIEHDQSEVIKYFICSEKCDLLDTSTGTDVNALNSAVKKKNFEVLKLLCTALRLDPYLESDRAILFEAVDNAAMLLFDLFKSYVDPLHHAAITGDIDSVRHYVEVKKWRPTKLDRHGNNSLHNAAQYGQLEVVKYLTGLNDETKIYCDPMRTNGNGLTAEEIASQEEHLQVVSYLLRATTNKLVCQQDILSPSLNIFVVGNSGAGKSTLAKALSKESSFLRKLTTVKGVTPLTAGIVPTTIDSQVFGDVRIYDFAGHEEYYASNEILLQQTSHPLVLLTVNISLSWQEIEKQLHYWLSILSNTQNCHVVVIGSHADNLKVKIKEKSEVYQNLEGLLSSQSSITYHGFIPCDCRYSSSDYLNQLRQKINTTCKSIRLALAHEESDDSNRLCASLMFHLKHNMPEQATITVGEICKQVKESESTCPNLAKLVDQDLLIQTCKNLSANGHMLFLPHSKIPENSFLVLDERIVLSRVHACLTVIKKELENNFGILDENQLQSILSKSLENMMDPDFAIKYLIFTQFCTEITSDQLISMSLDEKHVTHYFFPNLVLATRPPDLLPSGRQTYTNFYTWCLKCTNAHQFFTPRYLHTLFIQIVKCERDTVNTECKIWKNGILLVHNNGTRSIIEVTDQTTRVYLAIQCVEGYELQLAKQRSFLISLIKSLVHKICHRVKVEEFLLLSQETYPPNNTSEIPISKVALSVINGHGMVSYDDGTLQHEPVEDLLHFESFHVIKDKALRDCVRRDTNDIVPPTTLARIHSAVETCRELQERFEDESGQCRRRMTYSQVHKELTKYSIFTDGDLSVS